MSERPASVRIDDLAAPTFPAEIAPVIEMLADAGRSLSLEPGALMKAASDQSGLDDFGDRSFEERLDVLCRALDTEAGLSDAGLAATHGQLVGHLVNRLRLEDLLRRHPEIEDVKVEAPIIICGLPRTGTTHLHNLISSDPALRSLPYWESLEPVPAVSEEPAADRPDPRLERAELSVGFVDAAIPLFKRMHEMTVDHVHEEIQLLANDVSGMLFETIAPMPSWRDHYLARDQTPSYEYLRRTLQALQWLRGGTRWVLKSPQHVEQFGPLSAVFPDATFVVTHRDPVSVTLSTATMITYSSRLRLARVDPKAIGRYWADRVQRMLRSCVDDRELLPAERSIDVRFHEFMVDDIGMVERIYAVAGQPFDDGVRAAMEAFMATHQRGRHGGVVYDPSDVGLDRRERYAALAFYLDRFDVEVEHGP